MWPFKRRLNPATLDSIKRKREKTYWKAEENKEKIASLSKKIKIVAEGELRAAPQSKAQARFSKERLHLKRKKEKLEHKNKILLNKIEHWDKQVLEYRQDTRLRAEKRALKSASGADNLEMQNKKAA